MENGGDNSGEKDVKINIKCGNNLKFSVQAGLQLTVGEFKTLVAQNCEIPANQQRLIYKGRILKDDQSLHTYGLEDEHAIHLVRGFVSDKTANTTSVSAPAARDENSTPEISRGVGSVGSQGFGDGLAASLFPGLDASALGGSGASSWFGDDLAGFEQLEERLSGNPIMISEIMSMPAIQNLMNDPEIIRNFMMNDLQMREVIDRNPELAHVLNDPSTLRQTMEATRNPELMREMMRNTDRAMSNIESLPDGFNMLRRMYENVQEPLLSATSVTGDTIDGPGSNPFSALLVEDRSTTSSTMSSDANSGSLPNANPLPNPWSNDVATRGSRTNNTSGNRAGAHALGDGWGIPGLTGIDEQSRSLLDPTTMMQLLQNPAMLEMMNQMINIDPQLRGLVDSNPQVLEAMQNPEMLQSQLPSHERLQQSMASLSSLLGSVSQQSPLGTGQIGGGAAVPPEELYANQLSQLQDMGFIDTRENIQALLATSGNVNAAVERLLHNIGQ